MNNNQLRRYSSRKNFFPHLFNINNDFFAESNLPAANVTENDKQFKVELSVPGFSKEDFKIEIEKNILSVSASKENKTEEKDENEKVIRQEFFSSSFSRKFIIPENVDTESISAEQKNGVLNISLPKKELAPEEKVKKIEIK